jgi:hypothetical protein
MQEIGFAIKEKSLAQLEYHKRHYQQNTSAGKTAGKDCSAVLLEEIKQAISMALSKLINE